MIAGILLSIVFGLGGLVAWLSDSWGFATGLLLAYLTFTVLLVNAVHAVRFVRNWDADDR